MPDPIPPGVPLKLEPIDGNLEACINIRPLVDQRVFKLTMTGAGSIEVKKFRLAGTDAGRFGLVDPGTVTLTNGKEVSFRVTFTPVRVGAHVARVVFLITHTQPNGKIKSVWGRLPLNGLGKNCAEEDPAQPPPPDGEDENAGEGDGPGEGAGGGGGGGNGGAPDGSGGTGDGGGTPPPAPPPGGGDGTDPPPAFVGEPTEVCLRFWTLPGVAAGLGEADFDAWVTTVNQIYKNSGVQFRRGAGPIVQIPTPNAESDPHCFDIYVGGPALIPGNTIGFCEGARSLRAAEILREEGAAANYGKAGSSIGTSIQMETGHPPGTTPPSTTLAHELGHAMGLGPSSGNDHLNPTDGQPITSEDRLMHPASGGTKLTEHERRIAARMAKLLRGARVPGEPVCEKTTEHRVQPDPIPPGRRFRSVEFRNQQRSVAVTASAPEGFPTKSRLKLSLKLVAADPVGRFSASIDYGLDEGRWRIAAEPPAGDPAPALPAPALLERIDWPTETGAPAMAFGVRIEVPKDYFGLSHRVVGMQLSVSVEDAEAEALPHEGPVKLDLTPPAFTVVLSEASRAATVERGGVLLLKGEGWQSSTFTGQAGLSLWLRQHGVSRFIPLEPLPKPIPELWSAEAKLPDDLAAGEYRMSLRAACGQCGVETSASGTLTIV